MRHAVLAVILTAPLLATHGPGPQVVPAHDRLTFAERVEAQRAIEGIYHRHRLGERRPLAEAAPDALLEKKVRESLERSAALARIWKTPITDGMLRGEMARIRARTRNPDLLRELESALGGDELLIRETLARDRLSERLIRDRFAHDPRIHGDMRRRMESLRRDLERRAVDPRRDHPWRHVVELVREDDPGADRAGLPAAPGTIELEAAPFERERSLAPSRIGEIGPVTDAGDAFVIRVVLERSPDRVRIASYIRPKRSWDEWWAGVAPVVGKLPVDPAQKMLDADAAATPLGAEDLVSPPAAFCQDIDRWTALPTQDAPSPRSSHTAVWTGAEMIVWGGRFPVSGVGLATGAAYDPLTDSWRATALPGAPAARYLHTAVWTGSEMIVWGGNPGAFATGGRYDPVADTWTPTTIQGAPTGRSYHTAAWTGTEMIVWGGLGTPTGLATGGLYDPVADLWRPTSTSGAPAGRFWHTSVWTGREMIIWGGTVSSNAPPLDSGGRYDPSSDTWQETSLDNAPSPRAFASAVWTGSGMIVWGGDFLDTGGIYDPLSDSWQPVSTRRAPAGRAGHGAVWTGRLMAVWGGVTPPTGVDDRGGIYDPLTDVWAPLPKDNAPTGRKWHSVVMTWSEMIVWGGYDNITTLDSGAGYGFDVWPDEDGDGLTICDGDCDDTDPEVGGGPELPGNRRDEDCDGILLCDPDAGWNNPGAFRLCVASACADLTRRGVVAPSQCRRRIVGIPVPN